VVHVYSTTNFVIKLLIIWIL